MSCDTKRIYESGMVPPILNLDGTVNRVMEAISNSMRRANSSASPPKYIALAAITPF
jgi:hypothetical protein